ncbi:serine/threonine-protein kinase [Prosthecobacter sp.]|uniref:serine/threonine-protein kinase n=1 Tax=Prosthecobacter sp. TaxID=1965333 RepID=UPI0037841D7E
MILAPPEQSFLSTCPVCQRQIDVTSLEPFTKLKCPFCGQMVRVRRRFDQFMIVRQIGEGGMSRVFEAEDETLGRRVALKILNRQYSRDSIRLEQFRREAHITANVTHPNVIKLYSVGYDQGYFYIAMELVGGGSLEQRIRREGHLKEAEALRIGREVAEGLRAAQQLTLIHRDVKPANILFTETGTAKVVDFGLALFVDRGGDQSGEIWATPYYVAPEKVIENKEDYRSDIFSLGATLYHAMTGSPPHKADTSAIEDLRRIKSKRVTLGESGLRFSPRTEHVINGMLSFSPEDRFANYSEVVEEMRLAEGLLDRGGIRRRLFSRRARLIGSIAAAIVVAYAMGWLLREGGERRNVRAIQLATANESDLNGSGVTLTAEKKDKKTVTTRFTEARQLMLKEFRFADARHDFLKLVASKDLLQPTENWARFNAALCSIILKEREEAGQQFAHLATTPDLNGLAPFFTRLKARMADGFGLGIPTASLGYNDTDEEVLGYLVHGLAEWHHGDAIRGGEHLLEFQRGLEKIRSTTATTPASPLGWLLLYTPLIQRYAPDVPLVRAALQQQKYSSITELRAALADRQQKRREIKTKGPFLDTIKAFETGLQREISRMTLEAQHQQMEEDQKHRQADLELLGEVSTIVPSLVQGYDYSRAIEMLTSTHLETADVRNALDGRLYLYTQSRDFIRQITTDLATKGGWTGTITRREGGQLTGRITTNPQGTTITITITLDRGTLTLPFESLTPETLVEIAQSLIAQVTDSTDYYRRLESTAAFARLNGLTQLSTTIAAQLREENASFNMRWMKVMAAGI